MLFDITLENAAEYLRIDTGDLQEDVLTNAMFAAAQYIKSYTGLTASEIENYQDIRTAYLVLIQDMYDNRGMYVDGKSPNRTVDSILGMHVRNLV